jgi:hypothetical protein
VLSSHRRLGSGRDAPGYPFLLIEIALLLVLLAANPADTRRRARWLCRLSITLILTLVAVALTMNVLLIVALVTGGRVTTSADSLLASGTLVWAGNALVFGLLYWQLDSGGPLARQRGDRAHPCWRWPPWRPRGARTGSRWRGEQAVDTSRATAARHRLGRGVGPGGAAHADRHRHLHRVG